MLSPNTFQIVGTILIFAGVVAILAGIVIMISSVLSRQSQEIQKYAARLSSKGFTEELSGALGNAGYLIKELNTMIQSSRGTGMSLVVIGIILTVGSFILLNLKP